MAGQTSRITDLVLCRKANSHTLKPSNLAPRLLRVNMRMKGAAMNARARGSLRRATNVSLDQALVKAARELDINLSRACEQGLAREIKATREARRREENAGAIAEYNGHVAKHGLLLAKYRRF